MNEPIWVAKPAALDRAVQTLGRHSIVAVDTESNSLFAYREQVCLVQFSIPSSDYLIDPLAISDLSSLGPIFSNPEIEKVFHASEYDLICLKRDFGFQFRNIFDTMVASRILGRQAVGLGNILNEEFGIELDKRYQRANWGQRPLPAPQLAYARLDTHYLIDLRDRLKYELETSGRWKLAQEDFRRLEQISVPELENNHDSMCWKAASSHELGAQEMAVLHELCKYRDHEARRANLPHFKVMSNEVLVQTAKAMPATLNELVEGVHLSPKQLDRFGAGLVAAVKRGLTAPPPQRPHSHRPDDSYLARLDSLRNWRKVTGRELGVESDVVLPRDSMEIIAQGDPHNLEELGALMGDIPWRFGEYGEAILKAMKHQGDGQGKKSTAGKKSGIISQPQGK